MAIQLALAVAAAFGFGQWTDPDHLVWPVLTVLVVHSANRGRGDVLWKGTERCAGALADTLIATLLSNTLQPGDSVAIVAIFAILTLAAALREISYACRAACTTAALAFLYGYFGQGGTGLLADRLLGVAVGAAIGIGAAWFVLPVRTTDITCLRIAACLLLPPPATSRSRPQTRAAKLTRPEPPSPTTTSPSSRSPCALPADSDAETPANSTTPSPTPGRSPTRSPPSQRKSPPATPETKRSLTAKSLRFCTRSAVPTWSAA